MSDFKAKMHQFRFRLGLCPRPSWGAYSAPPDPLAGFEGPTSKGGEGRGGKKGGNERGGEGGEGRGEENVSALLTMQNVHFTALQRVFLPKLADWASEDIILELEGEGGTCSTVLRGDRHPCGYLCVPITVT